MSRLPQSHLISHRYGGQKLRLFGGECECAVCTRARPRICAIKNGLNYNYDWETMLKLIIHSLPCALQSSSPPPPLQYTRSNYAGHHPAYRILFHLANDDQCWLRPREVAWRAMLTRTHTDVVPNCANVYVFGRWLLANTNESRRARITRRTHKKFQWAIKEWNWRTRRQTEE